MVQHVVLLNVILPNLKAIYLSKPNSSIDHRERHYRFIDISPFSGYRLMNPLEVRKSANLIEGINVPPRFPEFKINVQDWTLLLSGIQSHLF
jgi:hypothetical protein